MSVSEAQLRSIVEEVLAGLGQRGSSPSDPRGSSPSDARGSSPSRPDEPGPRGTSPSRGSSPSRPDEPAPRGSNPSRGSSPSRPDQSSPEPAEPGLDKLDQRGPGLDKLDRRDLDIDVPDPTESAARHHLGVAHPANPSGLANLAGSTAARLAVGRAGPRPPTSAMLLFGADHAVTQDAIFGDVPTALLEQFGLFTVQTQVTTQDEFLLRPDLGRLLSDEARATIAERCAKSPQVQIVVGDGLSAAAVTNNLAQIYPVLQQGLQAAGLTVGTPFFVRYCRVGVMNDINDVIGADMVVLLIGERPGLGVADALSVYSGWRPTAGKTDAQRDVICMITEHGGTNPLEAGAFVVEHVKNVLAHQASGIELRLEESGSR